MTTELVVRQAPDEIRQYLDKLTKVTGWKEPIEIGVIDGDKMPPRVGVTDNPHGFLHIARGRPPLIVIRDNAYPHGNWQNLVAHEFLHVLHWPVDEWVTDRLSDGEHVEYMRRVEKLMRPLSILLMVGGIMNVEWVDEEPT